MINKNRIIKDFKELHSIKRLTENEIYRVSEKYSYKDLRGFCFEKYSFGENIDNNSYRVVFKSNDKFKAIKFLMDHFYTN